MATHSSPIAWKIPWTEEPGRLRSMELPGRAPLGAGAGCRSRPRLKPLQSLLGGLALSCLGPTKQAVLRVAPAAAASEAALGGAASSV